MWKGSTEVAFQERDTDIHLLKLLQIRKGWVALHGQQPYQKTIAAAVRKGTP